MANKPALADHLLTSDNPTFTTRAELEAWAVEMAHWANCTPGQTMRARLDALDLIRRVTLAHLHLRDTKADSDGDDGA
jgi:hypothetical protein